MTVKDGENGSSTKGPNLQRVCVCSQRMQQTQMSGGGILRANKTWCFVLTCRILNKSVKILLALAVSDIVCLARPQTRFFHSLFSMGPWIFRSVGMYTFYALCLLSLMLLLEWKACRAVSSHALSVRLDATRARSQALTQHVLFTLSFHLGFPLLLCESTRRRYADAHRVWRYFTH